VPFKVTGKIDKVTVDLKATTPSTASAADKAHKEALLKKGVSD
jgi:hypothetical protein